MNGRGFGAVVLLVALLAWPLIPGVPYDLLTTAILACFYLVVALSLVLLIGQVGQISLAQASLVGMGAFIAALSTHRLGLHFPFTLLVGLGAGAAFATLIGAVALRVRGLYLAVATLIFAYVCDQYLFSQPWLVESLSGTSVPPDAIGTQGSLVYFDLADAHVFYYPALAVAVTALYTLANLRESRVGRAFSAIRGSEVAAASLGIDVMRFKLLGFACAGGIAGLAGALSLGATRTVSPVQFDFTASLFFLSIAVVGGLRSIGGAVLSALLFAVLVGEVFFRFPRAADYLDLVSAGMLITVLLFFRGGLGALPERVAVLWAGVEPRLAAMLARLQPRRAEAARPAWDPLRTLASRAGAGLAELTRPLARVRRRRGEVAVQTEAVQPVDIVALVSRLTPAPAEVIPLDPRVEHHDSRSLRALLKTAGGEGAGDLERGPDGRPRSVLLSADEVTVRFGGLTAVHDASLQVRAGEIVGLIGPNGAGKTTLFNSVLGLNEPAQGRITLFGHDVTNWPVHERAALGVGRTFQILQLFGDLTVFENLLVATHLQNPTGLFGGLLVTNGARRAERAARARVRAVLKLMDLEHLAGRRVAGLPFGVLRLVEVARTLVTGARLVCFDEPASGLDSSETEGLLEWFRLLRQIGITLLVIEHDVDFVVRLCDHIYVLDQGRMIAQGSPAQVQRDPAVIASYLGALEEVS